MIQILDDNDNYVALESDEIKHGWGITRGTSFSAPIITGSLAVIYDYFNGTISPRESAQRLLVSADNTTCAAEICGRGIVNVGAALDPIDGLSLQFGDAVQQVDSWGNTLANQVSLLKFPVANNVQYSKSRQQC